MIPGEILPGDGAVPLNAGRPVLTLVVANAGDRPVQVGSHFHFAQANAALRFDRDLAWGHRLNVPADTALLIEVEKDLCAGGDEAVFGGGKVIRESMGQALVTRAEGAPDMVITGAVILDHWGVVKADVGVRVSRTRSG